MTICQHVLGRLQKRFDEGIEQARFEAFSSTLKKTQISESGREETIKTHVGTILQFKPYL